MYAVVIAVVVFLVSWAAIAARPWATPKPDVRLVALSLREQRLRAAELRERLAAAGRAAAGSPGRGSGSGPTGGEGGSGGNRGSNSGSSSGGSGGQGPAGCVLIDVRPAAQFGVMSLPDAVNLPFDSPERFRERHVARVLALAGGGAGDGAERAEPVAGRAGDGGAHGNGSGAGAAAVVGGAAAAAELGGLEQQRPVYVVCRRGNHSQLAVKELRAAGLADVFDLAGGMEAWAAEVDPGMPVL
jgi:rhodanese-related sulfurtransferase